MSGYQPKDLAFDKEARQSLISGIEKISKAVGSTLGPRGNTVIIESDQHTHGMTVTKDGVTVAKSIELLDPIENLGARIVRQSAEKTASEAGDGTTTSIVLSEALIKNGTQIITEDMNRSEVIREMNRLSEEVIDSLRKRAKRVTKSKINSVATISANNDPVIGKVISDAYKKVGKNGVITVQKSMTSDTYADVTKGIKLDRGYSSKYFVNDQRKDECIYEDVDVLITDIEIDNMLSIENILREAVSKQRRLLIIAPCSKAMVSTMAANVIKNGVKICTIDPPSFGYRQQELMSDIAAALGGVFFSESTGDDLSLVQMSDLGRADRIVIGRDESVIVRSEMPETVGKRIEELKEALALAKKTDDKSFIKSRIATLSGAIGVIHAGGHTDLEQKELYDRIDDAVQAVRSALDEGILPGGGMALFSEIRETLSKAIEPDLPLSAARKILADSLSAPAEKILSNAGMSIEDILYIDEGDWINVKTGFTCDPLEEGIIDPAKVTISALRNAVSVASTVLSTDAIVTLTRSYESN